VEQSQAAALDVELDEFTQCSEHFASVKLPLLNRSSSFKE
jgi:hypothetical protein